VDKLVLFWNLNHGFFVFFSKTHFSQILIVTPYVLHIPLEPKPWKDYAWCTLRFFKHDIGSKRPFQFLISLHSAKHDILFSSQQEKWCWNSRMGLRWNFLLEFLTISNCTNQKKMQLMHLEPTWCTNKPWANTNLQD
jgi:hypothetical protein